MLSHILLAAALSGSSAASLPDPVACIKTTIGRNGRTSRSTVIVSSGSPAADRGALAFVGMLDFARIPNRLARPQTGHMLVTIKGREAYSFTMGDLSPSCPAAVPGRT
jgi:hypothetical protein